MSGEGRLRGEREAGETECTRGHTGKTPLGLFVLDTQTFNCDSSCLLVWFRNKESWSQDFGEQRIFHESG